MCESLAAMIAEMVHDENDGVMQRLSSACRADSTPAIYEGETRDWEIGTKRVVIRSIKPEETGIRFSNVTWLEGG